MFRVSLGSYCLDLGRDALPSLYAEYRQRATLAEEFDIRNSEGAFAFVSVALSGKWPFLVVGQRFSPSAGGFEPGVLLVPETKMLFIGAGERLLAYRLDPPSRLWEDTAELGFWGWSHHGQTVLMSSELELAAWDVNGAKLWTTVVEPPWSYEVVEGRIHLDMMGTKSDFDLRNGPPGT